MFQRWCWKAWQFQSLASDIVGLHTCSFPRREKKGEGGSVVSSSSSFLSFLPLSILPRRIFVTLPSYSSSSSSYNTRGRREKGKNSFSFAHPFCPHFPREKERKIKKAHTAPIRPNVGMWDIKTQASTRTGKLTLFVFSSFLISMRTAKKGDGYTSKCGKSHRGGWLQQGKRLRIKAKDSPTTRIFNELFLINCFVKKTIVSKRSRQEFLFVDFEPRPPFPFDPTPELPCHYWPAVYCTLMDLCEAKRKKILMIANAGKKLVENCWHPFLFYKTPRLPVQWRFLCWNTCSIFVSFPPNCKRISPGQAKVCPPHTQKKPQAISPYRNWSEKATKKFFFSSLSSFSLLGVGSACVFSFLAPDTPRKNNVSRCRLTDPRDCITNCQTPKKVQWMNNGGMPPNRNGQ